MAESVLATKPKRVKSYADFLNGWINKGDPGFKHVILVYLKTQFNVDEPFPSTYNIEKTDTKVGWGKVMKSLFKTRRDLQNNVTKTQDEVTRERRVNEILQDITQDLANREQGSQEDIEYYARFMLGLPENFKTEVENFGTGSSAGRKRGNEEIAKPNAAISNLDKDSVLVGGDLRPLQKILQKLLVK